MKENVPNGTHSAKRIVIVVFNISLFYLKLLKRDILAISILPCYALRKFALAMKELPVCSFEPNTTLFVFCERVSVGVNIHPGLVDVVVSLHFFFKYKPGT